MTTTDRTSEPTAVFEGRLAAWEAREAAPEGWEQRVEAAANAAHAAVCDCGQGATTIDRWMIAAALSADARVIALQPSPAARVDDPAVAVDLVAFLQGRRRDTLRALRANTDGGADYWRWQGHAELSRQLLERLGAEVPQ